MTEIILHGARPGGAPHPRLGYAMVTAASALFAVNGTVSKLILTGSEITSLRLTELRATGAFLGLAAFLLVTAPRLLRIAREELALLVFYGIVGFALVQWLYLVAIERLPIGIGLLLEFTAPVLVALWARLVWHEPVRRRVWAALALALAGLVLVAEVWEDFRLDTVGVIAGLLAAGALATYYLAGEHQTARRDALSLTCLSLGVAALLWGGPAAVVGLPVRHARDERPARARVGRRTRLGALPVDGRARDDPPVRPLPRRAPPPARDARRDRVDGRGPPRRPRCVGLARRDPVRRAARRWCRRPPRGRPGADLSLTAGSTLRVW